MARSRLTSRAAVLATVLAGLVIALAVPTRQFVNQRGQIADQQRQAAEARREVAELTREAARWQDPSYVAAQARARLHYVRPGETGFVFPSAAAPQDVPAPGSGAAGGARAAAPWYRALWDSVDVADRTTTPTRNP